MSAKKKKLTKSNITVENTNSDIEDAEFNTMLDKPLKKNKSVEQLKHTMDIARRNISMIIDNLDGENPDAVLKKML